MERNGTALIVVDMQNDFMPDTSVSALPVAGGSEIIKGINDVMKDFQTVVATQDWHPVGHLSFAKYWGLAPFSEIQLHHKPQTLWPDHCVQGSWGAMLEPTFRTEPVNLVLRKGMIPDVDSYSAFQENWGPNGTRASTGLEAWLRAKGIFKVFICGLARDYCVRWTAEDAVTAGFRTYLFNGLSRSVNPKDDDMLVQHFKQIGVEVIR